MGVTNTILKDPTGWAKGQAQALEKRRPGWTGLGKMTYDAVMSRNYPLVMGTVLVTSGLYVICMIIADVVTAWIDPRVRSAL